MNGAFFALVFLPLMIIGGSVVLYYVSAKESGDGKYADSRLKR